MEIDNTNLMLILKQSTILLVDDDLNYQNSIKEVLLTICDNIIVANNGQEGFELYKKHNPKIIITDIEMPKLDGLAMTKRIRENDEDTAIIIITSFITEEYLLPAANLNIQGYMKKILSLDELKSTLYKAVKKFSNDSSVMIEITKGVNYDKFAGQLITKNTQIETLNKKEKKLLELLIKNKQNITTYNEIENIIWVQNDEVMTSSALRTLVAHLRKKSPINFIKNISGNGYVLTV